MEKPDVRKHAFTVPLPAPRYWQSRHQQTRVTTGDSELVQRTEPQRHLPVIVMALVEVARHFRCLPRNCPLEVGQRAAMLLNAANRAEPLPRNALPTQPRPTDPFAYPDPSKKP